VRLARRIAMLMRWGVVAATIILSIALVFDLLHASAPADVLAETGCVALVALPVIRLAIMAATFAKQRERTFATIAVAVIAISVASTVLGLAL
jgi:uncharacterized membrane protein